MNAAITRMTDTIGAAGKTLIVAITLAALLLAGLVTASPSHAREAKSGVGSSVTAASAKAGKGYGIGSALTASRGKAHKHQASKAAKAAKAAKAHKHGKKHH